MEKHFKEDSNYLNTTPWYPPNGQPKRVLISVYDKTDIDITAKELIAMDWEIVSSGGTAKFLKEKGIEVTEVSEITGMKAILSHRVVTLHPKIDGALLGEKTLDHLKEMVENDIIFISMVICDFYPLEEEISKPGATTKSVIDKTDIGGPTMVRAAAKGGRIAICDPSDRKRVIEWLKAGAPDSDAVVIMLLAKAEFIIAKYCMASAEFHSKGNYRADFFRHVSAWDY